MQPLSRVKPSAVTTWGEPNAMTARPQLAAKVAQCIAHWSEIEVIIGAFLALLLHANQRAALAMYSALENRAAQLRLITAAAEASLPTDHFNVISAMLASTLRPAMRERDKLAHWTWGFSNDLPEALLLSEPAITLNSLMRALGLQKGDSVADVPSTFDKIYVVRDPDLDGILKRSASAKYRLRMAMATVWEKNTQQQRDEWLQQLSNEPEIRAALNRLREGRQNNREAPQPSPPPEPSG